MLQELSETERHRIENRYIFEGKTMAEINEITDHSTSTIQSIITTYEENHPGAKQLCLLSRDLAKNHLTVSECLPAIPVVKKCSDLGINGDRAADLIDTAVKKTSDFSNSPQKLIERIMRFTKLEEDRGQTLEELETEYNDMGNSVDEETQRQNNIITLTEQEEALQTSIDAKQSELTALNNRVADAGMTDTRLTTYETDKMILTANGINIDDISRAKVVLMEFAAFNYNAQAIINAILQAGSLQQYLVRLLHEVGDLQNRKDSLTSQNARLEDKGRALVNAVTLVEEESAKKIEDSTQRVTEYLAKENVILGEVYGTKQFKTTLKKAGMDPEDTQLLKRALNEVKVAGGPKELTRQLSSNITLEHRRNELTDQINAYVRRKGQLGEEFQQLVNSTGAELSKRDYYTNQTRDMKEQYDDVYMKLETLKVELASALGTKANWDTINQAIEANGKKNEQLGNELTEEVAAAQWLISVLQENRPALFACEREAVNRFLQQPQSQVPYTENTAKTIIRLVIDRLKAHGDLVPGWKLTLAQMQLDDYKRHTNRMLDGIDAFLKNPSKATDDQKSAFLQAVAQRRNLGISGFRELVRNIEATFLKCPTHSGLLQWNMRIAKWICPVFNCTYTI